MRPQLLGPTGQPLAQSWDFWEASTPSFLREDTNTLTWVDGAQDTDRLLPAYNWKELMTHGRFLFANVPLLRGAILEQATMSFPITAQYTGADKEFGKKAEDWLYEWRKIANTRGAVFTDEICARIRLIGRKVDGDCGTLLTMTDSGYPKLQFIRAHRIASRSYQDGKLEEGPYRGNRIQNGVVIDRYGRTLAYHVIGEKPEEDQFISSNDLFLTFRPDYSDTSRGISELCAVIKSYDDIKRLREYEMRAQQILSALTVIEKNDTGTEDMGSLAVRSRLDRTTASKGSASEVTTRTFEKGMIVYVRGNSGNGLEAFRGDRPTADAQAFEDKIVMQAYAGIEWDANFSLSIKEPGGAWARTIIEKIRRCILNNQNAEAWARRREDGYAIAKAIKLGILPKPKNGDWFSWEYQMPARLTADSGNEENAKQNNYKLGSLTLKEWSAEKGNWWEEVRTQKQVEAVDLLTRAREINVQFPEMSLQECVALIEQRNPNPPTSVPVEKDDVKPMSSNEDKDE